LTEKVKASKLENWKQTIRAFVVNNNYKWNKKIQITTNARIRTIFKEQK